jgi:hypothetical protein
MQVEVQVEDVDAEHERLRQLGVAVSYRVGGGATTGGGVVLVPGA